jgi:electron transfer flavoprotein alpha subunit
MGCSNARTSQVRPSSFEVSTVARAVVPGATAAVHVAKRPGPLIEKRLAPSAGSKKRPLRGVGCGAVTDAIGLATQDGKIAVQRYALGGNTIATDVITSERQVIAVMPRTFETSKQPVTGETVRVELKLREPRVKIVERKAKPAATANIEGAESLVVAGKGFSKQEDLAIAEALAKALKGEVGCTRTLAADYHWLGEERMIGISGKKAKPRLMVSVGVSGQIQHTVGILGSKLIVAINKDKAAPIFKIADYGIVGDLYQVVPKLAERLSQ